MGSPPTTTTPAAAPTGELPEMPRPSPGLAFEAEHGLTGSRYIQFATRNLPPPSELYVVADDALFITVTNIQAGLTVYVSAQILLPDGRLSSNQFQVMPPATATPTQYIFVLTEGYLFNVTVQPAAAVRRGSCWVSVAIRRGGLTAGVTLQTLIQDYVDAFSGPTWPGGVIRSSTDGTGLLQSVYTAAAAAGQAYSYIVPANTRVVVRSVIAFFVASSQVATRSANLMFIDPAGNQLYNETVEATEAASTTGYYNWAFGLGWAQTSFVGNAMVRSLPAVTLAPGAQLQLAANNMQTGDQWKFINLGLEQWFSI